MEENIVGFEVAKLLKELGLGMDDNTYLQLPNWYNAEGLLESSKPSVSKKYNPSFTHLGADTINDFEANYCLMDNSGDNVLAPTQSLAQKWLREVHNIEVYVFTGLNSETFEWNLKYKNHVSKNTGFNTYEDALEEGLKKACLTTKEKLTNKNI